MSKRRPKAVDLFAGAGGLSLGFEMAGFDVVAAVEKDPVHALIHHYNFPHCAVLPRSVSDVTGTDIRNAAELASDEKIDVVFGGAPCQGFSLIGKRILDDPRNSLVLEFVRIVKELKADYFVFENVKGLTVGKHRKFLTELIEVFSLAGYTITTPWQVLNAVNYGVPQSRERLILFGSREGLQTVSYPEAETVQKGKADLYLPEGPSCGDALADLPEAEMFDELYFQDTVEVEDWVPESSYAKKMRCSELEHWHYGYPRQWLRQLLTNSIRTSHTDLSRQRFAETVPGAVEPVSRFFKLSKDGVSNTLRAGTDSARGAFTSPRPIHFKAPRCVTVREMARLQSFPDWFRFHSTKWHGARQIGNSVPPLMAKSIATSVLKAIGSTPFRPEKTLPLGDDNLLNLTMTQASEYWGIEVPIAPRDRKNKEAETLVATQP